LSLAGGCGGGSEAEGEEGEEAPSGIPASLGAAESDAEDIVALALANDRARMRETASELEADAQEAASGEVEQQRVPERELRQLRERSADVVELAAGNGRALAVALAANDVSALMPALFEHFEPKIPPAVLELDYLDREAQLRSLVGENHRVALAVTGLAATWRRLRPEVLAAGGEDEAKRFTVHVAAMQRLVRTGGAQALQREAVAGLELVDVLQDVFVR
jgi:hypothetical protein